MIVRKLAETETSGERPWRRKRSLTDRFRLVTRRRSQVLADY